MDYVEFPCSRRGKVSFFKTSSEKNKKHINVLQKHLRLGNNVFRSYIIFSELSKYAHADAAPNQGRIDAIKLKN